jgi:hypothetical protein
MSPLHHALCTKPAFPLPHSSDQIISENPTDFQRRQRTVSAPLQGRLNCRGRKWLCLKESEGIVRGFNFHPEEHLQKAILEIIASYQAIRAEDIWFELGEDEQFRSVVSHSEVNEALSRLEGRKFIRRGKDEKWRLARKKRGSQKA